MLIFEARVDEEACNAHGLRLTGHAVGHDYCQLLRLDGYRRCVQGWLTGLPDLRAIVAARQSVAETFQLGAWVGYGGCLGGLRCGSDSQRRARRRWRRGYDGIAATAPEEQGSTDDRKCRHDYGEGTCRATKQELTSFRQ